MELSKTPSQSAVVMTQLVMPDDSNNLDNLHGGRLLQWIDVAGALSAMKHCNLNVVTARIDEVDFHHSIKRGEMVEVLTKVIWVGNTSIEVKAEVFAQDLFTGLRRKTNQARLVFVAIGQDMKPALVPRLSPQTEEELEEFEGGRLRKELRRKAKTLTGANPL